MLVGDGVKTALYAYDVSAAKPPRPPPDGSTTASEYDSLNRLVKATYPEVKWYLPRATGVTVSVLTELSAHDANGSLVEAMDKRGVKTITTYHYLNKPVEVLVAFRVNKKNDAYEYDTEGDLVKITGIGDAVTAYEYDGINRRKKATPAIAFHVFSHGCAVGLGLLLSCACVCWAPV